MVLLIIIPIKWLFHWEYTQHFQTNPFKMYELYMIIYGKSQTIGRLNNEAILQILNVVMWVMS